MQQQILSSDLIINPDGTVFHLHLLPQWLADKVILVGDPARVNQFKDFMDQIEIDCQDREFHTITGSYKGKRITVLSTGIGCDNIDIVLTELDALKNIDFQSHKVKEKLTSMEIVRVGTCGGLQENTPVGTFVASERSIGFDVSLNFYADRDKACDIEMLSHFVDYMHIDNPSFVPYIAKADDALLQRIAGQDMAKGITATCNGFYGLQGRQVRLPLAHPNLNAQLAAYEYNGRRILNFEMESSAVMGMAAMLGHRACSFCMVVADRNKGIADSAYKTKLNQLISLVLERI